MASNKPGELRYVVEIAKRSKRAFGAAEASKLTKTSQAAVVA
jgi:hypothetical protein